MGGSFNDYLSSSYGISDPNSLDAQNRNDLYGEWQSSNKPTTQSQQQFIDNNNAAQQAAKPVVKPQVPQGQQYGATKAQGEQKPAGKAPQYVSTLMYNNTPVTTGYGITSQKPNIQGYLRLGSQGQAQNLLNQSVNSNMNTGGQYSSGEANLDANALQRFAPSLSVTHGQNQDINPLISEATNAINNAYSHDAVNGVAANGAGRAGEIGLQNSINDTNFARQNALLEAAKNGDNGALSELLAKNIKGGTQNTEGLIAKDKNTADQAASSAAYTAGVQGARDSRNARISDAEKKKTAATDKRNAARTTATKLVSGLSAMIKDLQNSGFSGDNARTQAKWQDFTAQMNQAIQEGGLTRDDVVKLLQTYGDDGMRRSGNWSPGSGLARDATGAEFYANKFNYTDPQEIGSIEDFLNNNVSATGYKYTVPKSSPDAAYANSSIAQRARDAVAAYNKRKTQ